MKLESCHVLITGGGAGIGRYLVEQLSHQVERVAVMEINPAACNELVAALPHVTAYVCDVSDPASVQKAIAQIYADGINVNVLVNNAGLIYSAPLVNCLSKQDRIHSLEMWHKTLGVNLHGVFYVTGQVVDRMLATRTKGVVINISSIAAQGNAGQSAYAAAKAGVNALTKTWAKELGCLGLRFAAIAPGFLDTPSTHEALSQTLINKLKQQIPLQRLGKPEHIYQAVKFLIENDYCNGDILDVNGGLVI